MITLPAMVYGTLRPGCSNHGLFLNADNDTAVERTRQARVSGYTMHTHGGFPYAVPSDDPNDTIVVDVIDVKEKDYEDILQSLDYLEGFRDFGHYANHYDRVVVEAVATDGSGEKFVGWMYVAHASIWDRIHGMHQIPTGDWKVYLEERAEQDRRDKYALLRMFGALAPSEADDYAYGEG